MEKVLNNLTLELDYDKNAYRITSIKEDTVDLVVPEECDGLPIFQITSEAFYGCRSLKSIRFSKNLISFAFTGWPTRLYSSVDAIKVDEGNPTFDSRNDCNAVIHKRSGALVIGCHNTVVPEGINKILDPNTQFAHMRRSFKSTIERVDLEALLKEQETIDFKGYDAVKLRKYSYDDKDADIEEIGIILSEKPSLDLYRYHGPRLGTDKGEHTTIDIDGCEKNMRLLSCLIKCAEECLHYDRDDSPYGVASYNEYCIELHQDRKVLKTKNKTISKEVLAIINHFIALDEGWALEFPDFQELTYTDNITVEYR